MTSTKHTPGPWEANGSTVVASKESFRALFDCKPLRMTLSAEECAANSSLIAAAPDLLAFAECSAAIDCGRTDPAYDPLQILKCHGWNGQENPGVFLARIRRNALEKALGHYLGRAAA